MYPVSEYSETLLLEYPPPVTRTVLPSLIAQAPLEVGVNTNRTRLVIFLRQLVLQAKGAVGAVLRDLLAGPRTVFSSQQPHSGGRGPAGVRGPDNDLVKFYSPGLSS